MTTSTTTTEEAMTAKFPAISESLKITDEPTLSTMFPIHRHMLKCARTQRTPLCEANMIFLVLNPTLFAHYSSADYPTEMENYHEPDPYPNYDNALDSNARQALRDGHAYDTMVHYDCKNMNAALVARFLQYLDLTYREQWEDHCIDNGLANPQYLQCWQFFLDEYGDSNSTDRTNNLDQMRQAWNPATGFETLVRQLHDGTEYATYAGRPLDGEDVVDMAEQLILQAGQYPDIYEEWCAEQNKSFSAFCTFWRKKLRLRKQTGQSAGKFGYGGNAMGSVSSAEDLEADQRLEESMETFGQAHMASQQTLQNMSNNNKQLEEFTKRFDRMEQMMYRMTTGNQPPPPPTQLQPSYYQAPPMPQQPSYQRRGRRNDNRPALPVAPTNYRGNPQNRAQPTPYKRYENWNYCHTHGGDCDHNSWECKRPGYGHNNQTTRQNYQQLGGSAKGVHKTILPSKSGRKPAGVRVPKPQTYQQPAMPPQQYQQQYQQPPPQQAMHMQAPPAAPMQPAHQPQQMMQQPQP